MTRSRLRAQPLGDSAITIVFGSERGAELLKRVQSAGLSVSEAAIPAVEDIVTGYLTLAVFYDPRETSYADLASKILAVCERATMPGGRSPKSRTHNIPVKYDGLDLNDVSMALGLSVVEVIERHTGRAYSVDLIGFVPGWAYLSELDPALHLPRRAQPRTRVPAGSVAIAGAQTGVYPLATPGGWHIIGTTHTSMFDPNRDPPAILRPGDTVRFVRVQ